jgi:dolichol-phosphate mannosyltransferase
MTLHLSIVIPIYNESACIHELCKRLHTLAESDSTCQYDFIFVDDGSKDDSFLLLSAIAAQDHRVKLIRFSRNFGHQLAVTAGLDHVASDAVVIIDADLQDPPEVITQMVALFRDGYDVVYAQRRSRQGDSVFKKMTAKLFYRLLNRLSTVAMPLDTGDFRLMSRRVVETLGTMRESDRFIRGMVTWVGFKQTALLYDRDPRFGGETKYPLRKMVAFAMNGLLSFSTVPLQCATWLGFALSGLSGLYILVIVALWFNGATFPGYASLMVAVLLLGGIQLITIGILGEYLGRLYMDSKKRPLYIIQDRINVT